MSAVGFAIAREQIILISDGMAMQNGQVYDTECSKIHKVNSRVALLWMGIGAHGVWEPLKQRIDSEGITEPIDIAHTTGQCMKEAYKDGGMEYILDSMPYWITTIGYDKDGNIKCYQLESQEVDHRYGPIPAELSPGAIGSMVDKFDFNKAPFARLLDKKYLPKYELGEAIQRAWDETLKYCKSKGSTVGGKRFMQILTPD